MAVKIKAYTMGSRRHLSLKHSFDKISLPDKLKLFSQMIADNIGDELLLVDREGCIVYVNDAAVKGLGYSRRMLHKKKITEFFKEKISTQEWQRSYFKDLKKKRRPIQYEIERKIKNGHARVVEVTAVYVKDRSEEYILSIGRDITEKAAAQKTKRDYDKKMALNLFVAGTTQEIKYPLNAVLTQLQVLMRRYGSRDFEYIGFKEFQKMMTMIGNISNQIRNCCDIVDKVTFFDKKRVGIKEAGTSANDAIRELIRSISQELESSNIKVSSRLAKRLPPAAISEMDLNKMVRNIIANALQAMPSGGLLIIRTYYRIGEKRIYLEFKDDGIGIPKENLSRVFEPFFTTKQGSSGQGVGLGLSVVYSIVKGAKGDISIKSSLRQGTLIKITLPIFHSLGKDKKVS